MKVLVTESCLTLFDPVNSSPQGSSIHGILQVRILEWDSLSRLQGIFPTQEANSGLLHCRQILYHLYPLQMCHSLQITTCSLTQMLHPLGHLWWLHYICMTGYIFSHWQLNSISISLPFPLLLYRQSSL